MVKLSYLIKCTKTGIYKIGESSNPKRRFNSIKTANPYVILLGASDYYSEKELHEKYKNYRFCGEWFEFPKDIELEVINLFQEISDIEFIFNDIEIEKILYDKILLKSIYFIDHFDIKKVNEFSDEVYKKLGSNKYKFLLNKCNEYRTLMENIMYSSLEF
jgi:hypothetical protein